MSSLSSEALQRFLYTCPLGLLYTDERGDCALLNGVASALLMPWTAGDLKALPRQVASWSAEAAAELFCAEGARHSRSVSRRVRPGGQTGPWLEWTTVPFDRGFSVTLRDVSSLVEAEQALKRASVEEALQRGRAEVAAGILHDLGNALTGVGAETVALHATQQLDGVIGHLQRLAELLARAEQGLDQCLGTGKGAAIVALLDSGATSLVERQTAAREHLQRMQGGLAHAQELLSINRSFALGSDLSLVDLKRLCNDLRDLCWSQVESRGSMEMHLPAGAVRVRCDRSKLIQILLNLAKNAWEAWDAAAEPEPLRLVLKLEAGPQSVSFTLRDNGPGLSPEVQKCLFEPGFSTKQAGRGLGLSSSQRLADALGARLSLHSAGVGLGCTAKLQLAMEVESDPQHQ